MLTENDKPMLELNSNKLDYTTALARSIVGAVPLFGSALSEAVNLIPNQREDRIAKTLKIVIDKVGDLEKFADKYKNEHFMQFFIESMRQSADVISEKRREHIANLIANGLTNDDIDYQEQQFLLGKLKEINDNELIILMGYASNFLHDWNEFVQTHQNIITGSGTSRNNNFEPQLINDMHRAYRDHLVNVGLLESYDHNKGPGLTGIEALNDQFVKAYKLSHIGKKLLVEIDVVKHMQW